MAYISITCPHCGAPISATINTKVVRCEYCDLDVIIDLNKEHDASTKVASNNSFKDKKLNDFITYNDSIDIMQWKKLRNAGIILESVFMCIAILIQHFFDADIFMLFFIISCFFGISCPIKLYKAKPGGYTNMYSRILNFITIFLVCNIVSFMLIIFFVVLLVLFGFIK